MAALLPPVRTPEDYEKQRTDVGRWLPAVRALAARHDLPAPRETDWLGGSDVVFAAGRAAVLKLWAPPFRTEAAIEQAALRAAGACADLPVPGVLAAGELEGWPYVAQQRMPGAPAGDVWPSLAPDQRAGVLAQIGALLRRLHVLPPPAGDWPAFVAEQEAACVERQRRWGVPAHLAGEIPSYLRAAGTLTDVPPVFLHADLTPWNVLVEERGGRWCISGLVDFGDAMAGHHEYDLMVPAIFLARGDRSLLEALFGGYGYAPAALESSWRARLTALALIHRFNDMTRFLASPPPTSLDAWARRLWP